MSMQVKIDPALILQFNSLPPFPVAPTAIPAKIPILPPMIV